MLPEIERFHKWLRRRSPGASTHVHYVSDVNLFFAWLGKPPSQVTLRDVDAYIEHAQGREHIPADAVFAVQAYYEIGPHSAQGVDAGFWLPYTTGRRTTLPPMPYNGELTPEAADRISQRAADTARLPAGHEALSRLKAEGVTHAYVVEPRISFFPGLWQPAQFAADPAYRLLYHQGSVWIFALDGAP